MIKMDAPAPLNIYFALGQRKCLQILGNTQSPFFISYEIDNRSP